MWKILISYEDRRRILKKRRFSAFFNPPFFYHAIFPVDKFRDQLGSVLSVREVVLARPQHVDANGSDATKSGALLQWGRLESS